MKHVEPIITVRAGLKSLLIALWAVVIGAAFFGFAMGMGSSPLSRMLQGALGVMFLGVGAYLLVLALAARVLASETGIEVVVPFPTKRVKELRWIEIESVIVGPKRRYLVFAGRNGERIPVGPGAKNWGELVELAWRKLPEGLRGPIEEFR